MFLELKIPTLSKSKRFCYWLKNDLTSSSEA